MASNNLIFDRLVCFAFEFARSIAQRSKLNFITKEAFFLSLYGLPEAPIARYVLSKGVKPKELETRRIELFYETMGSQEYDVGSFNFAGQNILVDTNLLLIIEKAREIAKSKYNSNVINLGHLTVAFSELYPTLFNHIMLELIPSLKITNALREYTTEDFAKESDPIEYIELPKELRSFLDVLNNKYSKDSICSILGRDEETEALMRVLLKKTKRNAVLVGQPGVGKTALVEKFTWMVVTGNCPKKFCNAVVLRLDVNAIVAGTQYRGSAEQRFQHLIAYLTNHPNCILFVDEIHLLLGAGACKDGDLDLANALKPLLARGDTRVIGATTVDEYEKYFSKDGALKRRFEKVVVNEPKATEVYDMIKNQIKLLEETHGVTISRDLVNDVIFKAACFNFETKNPDRTLDLLDKTMVCAELAGRDKVIPEDILKNFAVNMKRFQKMNETAKLSTAYHEAGHYIVSKFSNELKSHILLAVSIMPTDSYLGVNVFEIDNDVTVSGNKEYYIELIGSLLAGRVAEKMYSHTLTAGASSDLKKATLIARNVVTQYGLAEEFSEDRVYFTDGTNEQTIANIDKHIDEILKEARLYAEKLLSEKNIYLNLLTIALAEKGMLAEAEIEEIFKTITEQ